MVLLATALAAPPRWGLRLTTTVLEVDLRIVHSRVQHAVGQGSFHSASVQVEIGQDARYRYDYVYDCGALDGWQASPALLRSLQRLDLEPRQDSGGQPVIDALVLSHYDCDHIIGAEFLVSRFMVRRIIVPFLSPLELMLVLACQPDALTAEHIGSLHRLATGGADGVLFGIPVTQVQPGPYPGPDNDIEDRLQPQDQPESTDLPPTRKVPGSMQAVTEVSNSPVGATLPTGGAERVTVPGASIRPWRFKFWNRGVNDDLMEHIFLQLWICGFPLHALEDSNGVAELVDWLKPAQNRKATLAAYNQAITNYRPTWASEADGKRLANFLSLGMYSEPTFKAESHSYYSATSSVGYVRDRWWRTSPPNRGSHPNALRRRTGWLGTGDAPLGEPDVWSDFNACYRQELGRALTVQIPHHGAAPKTGPKFFNTALLPEAGMCAVISAGTRNRYGHPTTQVIKEVLATHAHLEIVTEESWLGFQEVFCFKS